MTYSPRRLEQLCTKNIDIHFLLNTARRRSSSSTKPRRRTDAHSIRCPIPSNEDKRGPALTATFCNAGDSIVLVWNNVDLTDLVVPFIEKTSRITAIAALAAVLWAVGVFSDAPCRPRVIRSSECVKNRVGAGIGLSGLDSSDCGFGDYGKLAKMSEVRKRHIYW